MTMTREASRLHQEYEDAPEAMREAIDAAYTAARKQLESRGFACSNDDDAEEFVAALYKYVAESAR